MKFKRFLAAAAACVLAASLAGCGSSSGNNAAPNGGSGSAAGSAANTTADSGEKTKLYVVNWKDYGSDDADFIKSFEAENNCEIVNTYMSSEEELLTKLKTSKEGEIDVCLPNCTILPAAIKGGYLAEIDTSKLSNFNSLFDRFKKQEECLGEDGKMYAVPFVWGSTAIAYNTDDIKEAPKSMSILFDKQYAGKIAFRDDYNDAVMAAAIVLGQDPNAPSDLDAIKQKLIEQKPLNRTYWKTGDEFSKLFAGKQISVGLMWSGQAASMKQEGEPIAFVVPEDGGIGWVDNWAIASGSQHKDLAYKFIDAMIAKDFQYNWASKGGPAPVNKEAADEIDPEYAKSAGMDEASLNRLYFMKYRTDDIKNAWNDLWTDVKAQ
ncbi:MAG: ABC transporter substrate-binding protein [Clostridia bacterium]|jgi:spermidine/putrescine transport system substrate-binding protein|nr:ABC transporter substrate-binding protein [Clostridia bacterium]MCI1999831.1 ABC transporter substrate-binding protein [Clostridia bacterium]MCI2014253.1 ABC transporter substrate-binding protein [Clostridia bacterium]